jgi:tetraacyldisaccharide 4'-kinase
VKVRFVPDSVSPLFGGESLAPAVLRGKRVIAFCGIAHPERFTEMLKEMGIEILDNITFPDHHRYTGGDLQEIRDRSDRSGASMMLTTEKDAARLASQAGEPSLESLPVYFVRIRTEIVEGRALLHSLLDRVANGAAA